MKLNLRTLLHIALLGLIVCGLPGCEGLATQGVQDWMAEKQKQIKPRVTPIPPPKPFTPEPYSVIGMLDPFDNQKLLEVLRQASDADKRSNVLLSQAQEHCKRQPLAELPLDSIEMVGILQRGATPVALLRANGLLHKLGVGDCMGQSYGRITSISETQIVLKEIIQDPAGAWVEKEAIVELLKTKPDGK